MQEQGIVPNQPGNGPGGLSANALKLIAIIAMLIDHIATVFLPYQSLPAVVMHFIGRITGPTMFFLVAEGYRHTRNVNRYTLRLAAFALVSYVPFIYCFTGALPGPGSFLQLNVIYTILLGLLAIRLRNEAGNIVVKIGGILVLLVLATAGDWGVLGILIMLAFDYFHGDFKNQAVAYCFVILCQGGLLSALLYPAYCFLAQSPIDLAGIYWHYMSEMGMFIPIVLLHRYNGRRGNGGKFAKWGFYMFYPLHLLALGLIAQFL